MKKIFENFDWPILICILILSGIGSATIASVSPDLLPAQMVFYVVGFILFFVFSVIDHQIFQPFRWLIYATSISLLLFTLFLGWESHGAVRWISLAGFRLQFSELAKPFLIVAFASFIIKQKSSLINYTLLAALILVPSFLIFRQPDFGSAVVYFFTFSLMLFFSEINLWYILASLFLVGALVPVVWNFLALYQKKRILTFMSPSYEPLGASYNAIQSVITVGSGMLWGRGLGRGTQSHLQFLPEHHTDFIFASIAEELGFVGSTVVLTVYFFLLWKIFTLAQQTNNKFTRLVAIGIGCAFLVQGTINIGMNLGILPVTGVPLPLLSYGGSSFLSTMIALGIIENMTKTLKGRDRELDIV